MAERHRQELENDGIMCLFGRIEDATIAEPIRWILGENLRTDMQRKRLLLMINSQGGDVSSAFALIDVMRGSAIPVHTLGLGKIASAGLLVFISGELGHRVLTPNTSILSHQWSWMAMGKEHELISRVAEYELITKRIVRHYKKCTGLSKKKVRKLLLPPNDVWLDPEEAKDLNLCDEIKYLK
jgi:ATP-dependent Clp protease protease subunit